MSGEDVHVDLRDVQVKTRASGLSALVRSHSALRTTKEKGSGISSAPSSFFGAAQAPRLRRLQLLARGDYRLLLVIAELLTNEVSECDAGAFLVAHVLSIVRGVLASTLLD